jgi:hypothetical protein
MLIGADKALFATTITTGNLIPEVANNTSCINARPCELVAVKTLEPAATAPTILDIAENSDSTSKNFDFNFPSATSLARSSTI